MEKLAKFNRCESEIHVAIKVVDVDVLGCLGPEHRSLSKSAEDCSTLLTQSNSAHVNCR